jgi:hypothetical protein
MIEITDKYIIIHMAEVENFEEKSLRSVWIDQSKGISEIMGMNTKTKEMETQSYVFDKNTWTIQEARDWIKDKVKNGTKTRGELLASRKIRLNSKSILCASLPNLSAGEEVKPLVESQWDKLSVGSLNDKYFFYTEGVHEGMNANGDYFYADELTKNYKSAGHQLIDWEHRREEIIGFSRESELITKPEEPLALGFNGILNRFSPYMQLEETVGDRVTTRDELIRERWFENKLAVSMEVFFDKMRCTECGFETTDFIEFDFHVLSEHWDIIKNNGMVGRGLIGIDFCGWGFVESPADKNAYVSSLRTSDDGTIKDIVDASSRSKIMAENSQFAISVAKCKPHDRFLEDKMIFASDQVSAIQTISSKKLDNFDNILEDKKSKIKGGVRMPFKLEEKISGAKTLSEVFVIAQKTLKDFQGENSLSEEDQKSFAEELAKVVANEISEKDFSVTDIFTISSEEKLEAVDKARKEEQATAGEVIEDLNKQIKKLGDEKTASDETLKERDVKIEELENKDKEKEKDAKINEFMEDVKTSGVNLTKAFEKDIRIIVANRMDMEDAESKLKEFKQDLMASVVQSKMIKASDESGNLSLSNDIKDGSMKEGLTKVREQHSKKSE